MKVIRIKNNTNETKSYYGQDILEGEYYTIQNENERMGFSTYAELNIDIWDGDAIVNDGVSDLTASSGDMWLKDIPVKPTLNALGEIASYRMPYASKSNSTHKFFKRIHGTGTNCTFGEVTNIDFVIPYAQAKIAKISLHGCECGDTINLKFYDTPTGTVSTVPNYMLNQFGFDVELSDGSFESKSEYDADVIGDMKIRVEYSNNGTVNKYIGLNIYLDQLVAI